ncbi:acetyl-CoA carboxylase 1-like protein [Tanacetum coccineum]
MATPEDMRINAEHIRIVDQFVEVLGCTNNKNYANVQLIVEGHAFEIPELPDALEAKCIIFLGSPATSIVALGDKIGSSLIAQATDMMYIDNVPVGLLVTAIVVDLCFQMPHFQEGKEILGGLALMIKVLEVREESVDEHEIGDEYFTEKQQQQQLVLVEESLRETLEEEARAEKEWDERIRQEQAYDELFRLEFEVKSITPPFLTYSSGS